MTCNLCSKPAWIYWRGPFCAECFAFTVDVFQLAPARSVGANPAAFGAHGGAVGSFPYPVELPACLDF